MGGDRNLYNPLGVPTDRRRTMLGTDGTWLWAIPGSAVAFALGMGIGSTLIERATEDWWFVPHLTMLLVALLAVSPAKSRAN